MTQTLATNNQNDIYLGSNGNLVMLRDLAAIEAACATAAKAQLGEEVLSVNAGIPNFQTIWVGSPNYAIFESYLRKTLENVGGVIGVQSLTLSILGDVLKYTATIQTAFGKAVING